MSRDAEALRSAAPRNPGVLALVVGPSGAGKDTLIQGAREFLRHDPRFVFPERVVTRPPHAAEDHVSVSVTDFARLAAQGGFALTWEAYGLHYGIPSSAGRAILDGATVVVNGSRSACGQARLQFERVCVILVDCPHDIRAARIGSRGRESAEEVQARLTRDVSGFDQAEVDARIDNAGAPDNGVRRLIATLRRLQNS